MMAQILRVTTGLRGGAAKPDVGVRFIPVQKPKSCSRLSQKKPIELEAGFAKSYSKLWLHGSLRSEERRDHEIVEVRTLYIPEYCLLQVAERKADILPVLRNVDARDV